MEKDFTLDSRGLGISKSVVDDMFLRFDEIQFTLENTENEMEVSLTFTLKLRKKKRPIITNRL